MAIFEDSDLDDFADLAEELALKDDCDILRATEINNLSGGGRTRGGYDVIATVKAALIDGRPPQKRVIAGQNVADLTQKILLRRGTDIRPEDRLGMLGQVYEIIDLDDPTSYEVLRRISVTRLEAGANT